MHTTIEDINGKRLLRFGNNLTIYEIDRIREEIVNALSDDIDLKADLSMVEVCDTAGIQLLVSLVKSTRDMKRHLSFSLISDAVVQMAKQIAMDTDALFSIKGV